MKKIAFIGAGNMGGAIVRGVCSVLDPESVSVYAPSRRNTVPLSEETGCCISDSMADAVAGAKYVVLSMKPQMLIDALAELAQFLDGDSVLVSIAAGIKIETIESVLNKAGVKLPVVRIMPNTPAAIGQGVLLVAAGEGVREPDLAELSELLCPCGLVERTSESLLDLGSPIMGCSPAFVYMFIEALADGGVKIGLPREKAQLWAAQAVQGAAALLIESGKHPGELKDAVCSPGGTTICGVAALEQKGMRTAVISAVEAAAKRNSELSGD